MPRSQPRSVRRHGRQRVVRKVSRRRSSSPPNPQAAPPPTGAEGTRLRRRPAGCTPIGSLLQWRRRRLEAAGCQGPNSHSRRQDVRPVASTPVVRRAGRSPAWRAESRSSSRAIVSQSFRGGRRYVTMRLETLQSRDSLLPLGTVSGVSIVRSAILRCGDSRRVRRQCHDLSGVSRRRHALRTSARRHSTLALVLVVSLLAHEFGHVIAARRHEVRIDELDLTPTGADVRLDEEPPTPRAGSALYGGPAAGIRHCCWSRLRLAASGSTSG